MNGSSNLRRTLLGIGMQMMQQLTGINFIFYFGTIFFQQLGSIKNPFLISLITTLVNVCSTPLSFYVIERLGRRTILIVRTPQSTFPMWHMKTLFMQRALRHVSVGYSSTTSHVHTFKLRL